jgi:hypothetical protein
MSRMMITNGNIVKSVKDSLNRDTILTKNRCVNAVMRYR